MRGYMGSRGQFDAGDEDYPDESDIEWGLKAIAMQEQGKMICYRCSEVITPCEKTEQASRQNYSDENGHLLCHGTWKFHAPFEA